MRSLKKDFLPIWISVLALFTCFTLELLLIFPKAVWRACKFPVILGGICYDCARECKEGRTECEAEFSE